LSANELTADLQHMHSHSWRYFALAPKMEAEHNAKYMRICLDCQLIEYLNTVPEGADFIGETLGNT